jgi:hypothetical protein
MESVLVWNKAVRLLGCEFGFFWSERLAAVVVNAKLEGTRIGFRPFQ